MTVEGTLDLFRLPEILQVISQQGKTGILTVQGTDDIIAVSFLEGRIVAADALNETTEEGLGAVLTGEGWVSEDTLRSLSAQAESEGVRLAEVLVRGEHMDRGELLEALRLQTFRLLMSLLDWSRGEFKFYAGDEVSYEDGFRSIGVDELLLRAIEDGAGGERGRIPAPESRFRKVDPPPRPVRLRSPPPRDGVPAPPPDTDTAIWMDPDEERVLEAVGPGRTVSEVARQAGVATDRARYVLYRLAREGVVASVGTPRGERAAGPAASRPAPAGPAAGAPASPPPGSAPGPAPGPALSVAPEPEAAPARSPEPRARPSSRPGPSPVARLSGWAVGVLLVAAAVTGPVAFVFPFPWLGAERAAFHDEADTARLLELDLAAKTYFLLEGRFPDRLEELVDAGLLGPGDVTDSRGRRLLYEPREGSYAVRAVASGTGGEDGQAFREGVAGNFLLDPEFLPGGRPGSAAPPLVLLD